MNLFLSMFSKMMENLLFQSLREEGTLFFLFVLFNYIKSKGKELKEKKIV
jgi:hypothetical protein